MVVTYIENKAQREAELRPFLKLMLDEGVRRYLEVGVQRGLTFLSAGLTMPPGARMVGVDWPGKAWGVKDGSGPELIRSAVTRLEAYGQDVTMIFGDSRDPAIIERAGAQGPYDLAFIDADHSLEGVTADWENYGSMARIVVFHDIDTPNKRGIDPESLARYGVHTLWADLRERYRHVEFISEPRGMGIGVLWRE